MYGQNLPNEYTALNASIQDENETAQLIPQPVSVPTPLPVSVPTPLPIPQINSLPRSTIPTNKFVHPFIELINKKASEAEMISLMALYMGINTGGIDSNNQTYYYMTDQVEFIAPVLQVFSYATCNGKEQVTKWLMDNFIPLDVSYDNNFCYFESIRWGHSKMADLIATHESFIPTTVVLENLSFRQKYDIFRLCMSSPRISGLCRDYRFTFIHYIDTADNSNMYIYNLIQSIKQKEMNPSIEISDQIYPDPKNVIEPNRFVHNNSGGNIGDVIEINTDQSMQIDELPSPISNVTEINTDLGMPLDEIPSPINTDQSMQIDEILQSIGTMQIGITTHTDEDFDTTVGVTNDDVTETGEEINMTTNI